MYCNRYRMIILQHIKYREKISPVMSILTHPTDKRQWSCTRIRNVERYISHILPRPPESKLCTNEAFFILKEKDKYQYSWKEALKEASTQYCQKFSEGHENNMSRFMKNKVCSMNKCLHNWLIDSKGKKLYGIEKEKPKKDNSCEYHS